MKSRVKLWLVMGAVIAVMAVWLSVRLFLHDAIAGAESDICIWVSLSRQLLDFGLAPGELVTYYNRSIIDLIVTLPVVAVFGLSTKVAILSFAIPYAIAFAAVGYAVAWRRDGADEKFDPVAFLMFNLLVGALFQYNTGHALTFAFAAMAYVVLFRADRLTPKSRWLILTGVSFLGYVNDDFFMLMVVLPLVGLNAVQYLASRRLNLLSVPVLIGTGLGAVLLKALRWTGIVDYSKLGLSAYPFDKMVEMITETIKAYASNFMLLDLLGQPLKLPVVLQIATYGIVAGLSVLAVICAMRRVIASRMDSKYDPDLVLLLALGAITSVYAFVASPTKPQNEMVPRYVYYGMILMLLLFVRWWRVLLPTRRLRIIAFLAILSAAGFSLWTNVLEKRGNVHARDRLVEVAEKMHAEGIDVAYCEWWTAKTLEAAAKGMLRVYPVVPSPHAIVPMDFMYCLRRIYGERCHAFVVPLCRAHYPGDVAEATVTRQLGRPDRMIETKCFKVFVYKKDIALKPRENLLKGRD